MCDGPQLEIDQQYLMYTRRFAGMDIPARGCTRSNHVKFAAEDLSYLEGLENANPVARVFGRVQFWPDGPGGAVPLAGASVRLEQGDRRTPAVTTDAQGRYSFDDLDGGKYSAVAVIAGYHMPEHDGARFSATVQPRGCAQIDVTLQKDWSGSISGRLIRSDGTSAAAGIDLLLIRLPDSEHEFENPFAGEVSTDEHGGYSFRHLRPGKYKVAVHWCCFPLPNAPYPPIYWPAGSSEEEGREIEVGGDADQRYDFLLPPEVRSATLSVQVLLPDGMAATTARVFLLKLPDRKNVDEEDRCCALVDATNTDADGRFSFEIMDGLKYILSADVGGESFTYDAPISFGDVKTPIVLRLQDSGTQKDKR